MTSISVWWLLGAMLLAAGIGYLAALVRGSSLMREEQARAARAEAELAAQKQLAHSQLDGLVADQGRLSAEFRALAADALAANNEQFLGLAEQRLRATQVAGQADMQRREEAVRALVDPIATTLGRLHQEVSTAERERLTGTSILTEQVRAMREASDLLRAETSQLVTALRSSQVRGRWGEVQLKRVVEAAGMLDRVDFVEQPQVHTDDGALRPDMVVRLAGGKQIVIDAKVAFLGYLDAHQTGDESERRARLAAHSRHFRKHIDDLAAKRYWDQFAPAPEFVVMFVPAEPFFHAALEQDGTLFEYAFERNVVIATPMTLLALLRTVAYAWRQETLAENAQQVLTLGKELHGRIATLSGHLSKLGRSIEGAAAAYNQAVGSLETRVLVSARRFADLNVVDSELASPRPVNPQISSLSAPEMLGPLAAPTGTAASAQAPEDTGTRSRAESTSGRSPGGSRGESDSADSGGAGGSGGADGSGGAGGPSGSSGASGSGGADGSSGASGFGGAGGSGGAGGPSGSGGADGSSGAGGCDDSDAASSGGSSSPRGSSGGSQVPVASALD